MNREEKIREANNNIQELKNKLSEMNTLLELTKNSFHQGAPTYWNNFTNQNLEEAIQGSYKLAQGLTANLDLIIKVANNFKERVENWIANPEEETRQKNEVDLDLDLQDDDDLPF